MQTGSRTASGEAARGQTSIDFLIAAGVFLLAVGFVFSVIPGMIDPFADAQEETLVADRTATQLAEGMLGIPDRTSALNATCVVAFFHDTEHDGGDCPVAFNGYQAVPHRIGIDDRYRLNVTIERNVTGDSATEVMCLEDGEFGACGSGTRLADGPAPPSTTESIATARRTVYLDDTDATLVVRLW